MTTVPPPLKNRVGRSAFLRPNNSIVVWPFGFFLEANYIYSIVFLTLHVNSKESKRPQQRAITTLKESCSRVWGQLDPRMTPLNGIVLTALNLQQVKYIDYRPE